MQDGCLKSLHNKQLSNFYLLIQMGIILEKTYKTKKTLFGPWSLLSVPNSLGYPSFLYWGRRNYQNAA
jgi:hypothetical protein